MGQTIPTFLWINGKDVMKEKLRLGLLMDSFAIPRWEYAMIEKIARSHFGEIVLVVLNDSPKEKRNTFSRFKDNWSQLAYRGYRSIEDKLFKVGYDAFRNKDSKTLLAEVPTLKVKGGLTRSSDCFDAEAIKGIKSYSLDVLIQLGFRVLEGEIVGTARCGVWSYYPGDSQISDRVPAGFWEVLENHPTTYSSLKVLDKRGNDIVIYGSNSSTHALSVRENCNRHHWRISSFLPRKLEELHTNGEEKLFKNVERANKTDTFCLNNHYRVPKNGELLVKLTRHFLKVVNAWLRKKVFIEQWILLYDLTNDASNAFLTYKRIVPPKDRLWADPHVIHRNGNYYIFLEEKLFETDKGNISLIVMDEKGHYGAPMRIIEKPYHLSYPFVFEWKGEHYLIPESGDDRTIQLYKCVGFPDKWEFQHNLMENIEAADTTLFYHRQKWWLFTSIKEHDGYPNWDELFLFYSDNLLSKKWTPHPLNPIISDVRKARPAGKIFQRNGDIYRPSQNSSKRYGYGLKFNQIVKLSETEYEEIEVRSIEPTWDKNISAVHSFNKEGNLTVIDGKLRRVRFLGG